MFRQQEDGRERGGRGGDGGERLVIRGREGGREKDGLVGPARKMAGKMEGSLSIMPRPLAPVSLYAPKNSLIDLRKTGHLRYTVKEEKEPPLTSPLTVDSAHDGVSFPPRLDF